MSRGKGVQKSGNFADVIYGIPLTLPVCISDARGASRPGAPPDGHGGDDDGGVGQELPQNTSSLQRPAEVTEENLFKVQYISTIWSLDMW